MRAGTETTMDGAGRVVLSKAIREGLLRGRIIASLVSFLCASSLHAADWPAWGGPNDDFTVPDAGVFGSDGEYALRVAWRRPIGTGYAAVVVRGDRDGIALGQRDRPEFRVVRVSVRAAACDGEARDETDGDERSMHASLRGGG